MRRADNRSSRTKGSALVLLILLPLLCFAPWVALTGPLDFGRKLGILSDVAFDSHLDPQDLGALARRGEVKSGEQAPTVTPAELLFVREAASRLQSVATTAMLVLVAIGAGWFGWRTAWRESAEAGERRLIYWIAVPIVIVLLLSIAPGEEHRIYRLLGNRLFETTIGRINNGASLRVLDYQQLVSNTILVLAAVGLTFGSVMIAIRASHLEAAADRSTYGDLKRRLDMILIGSALMLAAGVLDVKQWTALPLPFFPDERLAAGYAALAGAFVAFESVCFVAALVAMFLPTALVLDDARVRIEQSELATAVDKVPQRSPLERFVVADIMRAAAMLAPVLVGPVASFANIKIGV